MTTVALPPPPDAPAAPPPARRRPRLRRPAHEPEPVGTTAAPVPGLLRTIPPAAPRTSGPPAGSGPARYTDPPSPADEVTRRATTMVRTMVEVLAGRRAPSHLATIARPAVVRYVTASRVTGPGSPTPPARVHVSRPARDAAEVVAVCRFGTRTRALAVRLDRTPGTTDWCATAVRLL